MKKIKKIFIVIIFITCVQVIYTMHKDQIENSEERIIIYKDKDINKDKNKDIINQTMSGYINLLINLRDKLKEKNSDLKNTLEILNFRKKMLEEEQRQIKVDELHLGKSKFMATLQCIRNYQEEKEELIKKYIYLLSEIKYLRKKLKRDS